MTVRTAGLAGIDVESGVTEEGKPFCHIRAASPDAEVVLNGQLTPDEARVMALQWLEAAEAAEHDAAVFGELHELGGFSVEHIAAFLVALRRRRQGAP